MTCLPTLLLLAACSRSPAGPEEPPSLDILPAEIRLRVGESVQLQAVVRGRSDQVVADGEVTWDVTDPNVAGVSSSGMLTAVSVGTTQVSASVNGKGKAYGQLKKSRPVTVEESTALPASVTVQPGSVQIEPLGRTVFSAELRDASGNVVTGSVTWTATGGSIDATGEYVAGQSTGAFRVIAAASTGVADTAQVSIASGADVNAGPDQTISLPGTSRLSGAVGDATLSHHFWTKVSGPGTVRFSHEEFYSGWETGDFSEWRRHKDRGDYVTTARRRSGRQSWAAHADPTLPDPDNHAAKVLHWGSTDYPRLYISAWFYWPGDYEMAGKAGNFVNLLQFKQAVATPQHDPTWIVGARRAATVSGDAELVVFDWRKATGTAFYYNRVALPKDRWVNVSVYIRMHHTAGVLIVWVDGEQKFAFRDVNTLGDPANSSTLMWGVGNYGKDAAEDETVWWDDVGAWRADQNDVLGTTASFSEPGTYVLRLTASGDGRTGSDDVTITVR